MPLRLWLAGLIALVLVGTLAAGGVLTYWHAAQKIGQDMHTALTLGRRIAHKALHEADSTPSPRRRLEHLISYFDGDRTLRAWLVDSRNRNVASSTLEVAQGEIPDWLFRGVAGHPKVREIHLQETFEKHGRLVRWVVEQPRRVEIDLPEVFRSEGRLFIEADPTNQIVEMWRYAKFTFTVLAGAFGAMLLLLFLVLTRVLQPLQDVVRAFERVGEGNYTPRVAERGPRELARLGVGFNRMASHLAAMDVRTQHLHQQIETLQEEERAELSRNLHDEVSPLLFCIDVDATTIRDLSGAEAWDRIEPRAEAIQVAVSQVKRNVKTILGQLRPSGLGHVRLRSALEDLLVSWRARHPDIAIALEMDETEMRGGGWGEKLDGTIYNVVRESVNNALKHAAPRRIDVRAGRAEPGLVRLVVEDDGCGFRPVPSAMGYGLLVMRERVAMVGGTLAVGNRPYGQGTVVAACFPIAKNDEKSGDGARGETLVNGTMWGEGPGP